MKKALLLALCFALFVPVLNAEFSASVYGGYTTFAMGKVNEQMTKDYNETVAIFTPPAWAGTKTLFSGGYLLGGKLSLETPYGIAFDIKSEYTVPSDGIIKIENAGTNSSATDTSLMTFIPVLGGVSFNFYIPGTQISLGASGYAGYSFANLLMTRKWIVGGSTTLDDSMRASGGCITYEALGNIGFKVSKSMDATLQIGYRSAVVAEMLAASTNSQFYDAVQGEPLRDDSTANNVLPYDFSGIMVNLSLSNRF